MFSHRVPVQLEHLRTSALVVVADNVHRVYCAKVECRVGAALKQYVAREPARHVPDMILSNWRPACFDWRRAREATTSRTSSNASTTVFTDDGDMRVNSQACENRSRKTRRVPNHQQVPRSEPGSGEFIFRLKDFQEAACGFRAVMRKREQCLSRKLRVQFRCNVRGESPSHLNYCI